MANGGFDEYLFEDIAPHGWEYINLFGEYTFDVKNVPDSDKLRPINIAN